MNIMECHDVKTELRTWANNFNRPGMLNIICKGLIFLDNGKNGMFDGKMERYEYSNILLLYIISINLGKI